MMDQIQLDLWNAVFGDNPEAVDRALALGGDPGQPMPSRQFPLWLDYRVKVRELGENIPPPAPLLRELPPSPTDKGEYMLPFSLDNPAVLGRLLAAGANPGAAYTASGHTPLHLIAWDSNERSAEAAALLLAAGAPVDKADGGGNTPLQAACFRKADSAFIALLLARGASVQACNHEGDTALHLAGYWDEGFLPWPLDILRLENAPITAETLAIFGNPWGAEEAVAALAAAGADPNVINWRNGNTPMHTAMCHGYPYLLFLEALHRRGGKATVPNHLGKRACDFRCDPDDEKGRELAELFRLDTDGRKKK